MSPTKLCIAVFITVAASAFGQAPLRPTPDTHECFLKEMPGCGPIIDDVINVFGCVLDRTDARYYNRHRIPVYVDSILTVVVSSSQFFPEVGISRHGDTAYRSYTRNTGSQTRVSLVYKMDQGTADIDVVARGFGTGRYRLEVACVACVGPFVVITPVSTSVSHGQRATLILEARGTEPLSYVWYDVADPRYPLAFTPTLVTFPLEKTAKFEARVGNGCGTEQIVGPITVTVTKPNRVRAVKH